MGLRDLLGLGDDNSADPNAPLVLLVGHCGFDSGSLTRAATTALPGATVKRINDYAALTRTLDQRPDALLLINRQLDGRFSEIGGPDGVALIGALEPRPRCLLISNFPEAQAAAEAAGASPGFGKSDLGSGTDTKTIEAAFASVPTAE